MTLLQLPLWNFFKSLDSYPEYFGKGDYWFYVFVCFLAVGLVVLFGCMIYSSIYDYYDKKNSSKKTLRGNLIDKRYIGEQSPSGTGTAIVNGSNGVGVGIVSTSSHSDEEFLFFVKSEKVYKIEVDMQQFYSKNMGDAVLFEVTIGGFSKEELDINLTN